MNILIMGCGRTGSLLATMLSESGDAVTVIDWTDSAFMRLPENFAGATIQGNAVDLDVLKTAGVESADVFIAATSGDNRNIMASQIAKQVFEVPQVISRIKDPDRAEIFHSMGIEVDCRTSHGAGILLDLVKSHSNSDAS